MKTILPKIIILGSTGFLRISLRELPAAPFSGVLLPGTLSGFQAGQG